MGRLIATVLFALLVGIGLTAAVVAITARQKKANWRRGVTIGLIGALVIFLGSGILDSFTQVQYGSVAVVTQFGRVVGVFKPGLNWKVPFVQDTIPYRTQEIVYETSERPDLSAADYRDWEVDTATADGQHILARYTVRFSINPDKAAMIAEHLGTEERVVEKVVKAASRVHVRNILKSHRASELYSGDVEAAQAEIEERLTEEFAPNGLTLSFFGLRSIQFDEDYTRAVEQKQIEAENIITKENLAKQAEFEKKRVITEAEATAEKEKLERIGRAEGDAGAIRVKAQAEADAITLKAEAQAEANRLIAASLTEDVIRWQAVEWWDGSYPTVMGGGDFILPGDLFAK
jgi:regulator of protease activity HflC (stomatin/prohibitin superfamily)